MTNDEEDDNHQSLHELLEQLIRLQHDFIQDGNECNGIFEDIIKESGGSDLLSIPNADELISKLDTQDRDTRHNALSLLIDRHVEFPQLQSICHKLASDDDTEIRATAIYGLGEVYSDTQDKFILNFLASIVANQQLEDSVRIEAFISLLQIRSYNEYRSRFLDIRVLDDIDWSIVNLYRSPEI